MSMKFMAAAALPLALGACAASAPAEVLPLVSPADANAGIRYVRYHSVIGDYVHREATGPLNWRELNAGQGRGGAGAQ